MTAGDFTRDVRAELEQLRRAHVVAGVEISTDLLVAVRFAVDGQAQEFTTVVTTAEQRQAAFARTIEAVRRFRREHAPSRRPTPRPRLQLPLERAGGEPLWLAVVLAAAVVVTAAILGWCLV